MRKSFLFLWLTVGFSSISFARPAPVRITGSHLVQKIIEKMEVPLKKKEPKIKIEFVSGNFKTALDELSNRKVDIVMFTRDLTSEEINGHPKIHFNSVTIGRDAIMPVVSFELFMSGIKYLTFGNLMQIYNGEVTNWEKLGGPKQDIYALDLQDESGTRNFFMQTIFNDNSASTAGVKKVCTSDEEVQTEISHSSGAIAYLSSAWTSQKIRGIGIRNENGVIYPTPENILSHEYPLSRNLILVMGDAPTAEVKKLMNFIMGPEGQKIVQEEKHVPAIHY